MLPGSGIDPGYAADLAGRGADQVGRGRPTATGHLRSPRWRSSSPSSGSSPARSASPPASGSSAGRAEATRERLAAGRGTCLGRTRLHGAHGGVPADGQGGGSDRRSPVGRLPYLVYLRHPTTAGCSPPGGRRHVTAAGWRLIGFLGRGSTRPCTASRSRRASRSPRTSTPKAESTRWWAPNGVAEVAARVLEVLVRPPRAPPGPRAAGADHVEVTPVAESIRRSPAPQPSGGAGLAPGGHAGGDAVERTAAGEMDPGVLLALVRFGAAPCILLGQGPAPPAAAAAVDQPICGLPAGASASPPSWTCHW